MDIFILWVLRQGLQDKAKAGKLKKIYKVDGHKPIAEVRGDLFQQKLLSIYVSQTIPFSFSFPSVIDRFIDRDGSKTHFCISASVCWFIMTL